MSNESNSSKGVLGQITAAYSATDKAGTSYELNIVSSNDRSGAMTGTLDIGDNEYTLKGEYRFRNANGAQTDIYFAGSNTLDHNARSGYFFLEAINRRYESLKGKRVYSNPHTQELRIFDIEFVKKKAL